MTIQAVVKMNVNPNSKVKALAAIKFGEIGLSVDSITLQYVQVYEEKGLITLKYPTIKAGNQVSPIVVIKNENLKNRIYQAIFKEYTQQKSEVLFKNLIFEDGLPEEQKTQ